jgi:hypothetical protein
MASQVIQRANNSSTLYATIKSRGSNSGPAGCGYIYASEVNQCPCFRHKVKVTPQNSPGFDRTVRFELPNYGFLEHVFLESKFTGAAGSYTNDKALTWGAGAFLFSEARIVFRGQEVAKISSDYIMTRHMMDLSEERLDNFFSMVGGFPLGIKHDDGAGQPTGRFAQAETDQRFYCPLNFWFTETRSRALDLSILHSPVTVEIDVRGWSDVRENSSDAAVAGTALALEELNLQCYLAELPAPELKMFRDVSYKPGGEPLSQLGYDILSSTHSVDVSTNKKVRIKLNDFSGLVQRMYIITTIGASRTQNRYLEPPHDNDIKTVKFQSVDNDLYERENMNFVAVSGEWASTDNFDAGTGTKTGSHTQMVGERLMDRYNQPSRNLDKDFIVYDCASSGANVNPSSVHVINFKSDWDQRTSATGSVSFGTIHNPTLELEYENTDAAPYDVIIIAELNNLMLYKTNGAGATSIQRIT